MALKYKNLKFKHIYNRGAHAHLKILVVYFYEILLELIGILGEVVKDFH